MKIKKVTKLKLRKQPKKLKSYFEVKAILMRRIETK